MRHARKHKSIAHLQEKKHSIETIPEGTQVLGLLDKDFKPVV